MANRKKQVLKAADGVLAPEERIVAAVLSQPTNALENGSSADAPAPEVISRLAPDASTDAIGFAAKVPAGCTLWWGFSDQRLLGFTGRQFFAKPSKLLFEFPSDVLLGLKLAGNDGAERMEVHFVDGSVVVVGVPKANSGIQEFAADADQNGLLLPERRGS